VNVGSFASTDASASVVAACDPVNDVEDSEPPNALTPDVHLRPLAGARRAIPRTIHGVRLAITSTARSERRIAVRR
jgi:hypothetical protein